MADIDYKKAFEKLYTQIVTELNWAKVETESEFATGEITAYDSIRRVAEHIVEDPEGYGCAKTSDKPIVCCGTCKYLGKSIYDEPCMDCDPRKGAPNCNWEEKK